MIDGRVDRQADGRGRRAAGTVIDGIGEAVAGGLGAVVRIGESAVVVVDDGAVAALGEGGDARRRQRAVGIAVVGQHVDRGHRAAFRNRGGIAVRHRRVVGAEDVDGHRGEGAVGAGDREGVGVGGAGRELVVLRAGGVGPGAGAIDGEGAVAADGAGLRHEAGGAVDVADGERAGGGDVDLPCRSRSGC